MPYGCCLSWPAEKQHKLTYMNGGIPMLAYAHREWQLFASKLCVLIFFNRKRHNTDSWYKVLPRNEIQLLLFTGARWESPAVPFTVLAACVFSVSLVRAQQRPCMRYELPGDAWLRLIARWNSTWETILVRVKCVAIASVNVDLNTFQWTGSPECTLKEWLAHVRVTRERREPNPPKPGPGTNLLTTTALIASDVSAAQGCMVTFSYCCSISLIKRSN